MKLQQLKDIHLLGNPIECTLELNDRRGSAAYYKQYPMGRTDIAFVQVYAGQYFIGNVFFFANGTSQFDQSSDMVLDEEMRKLVIDLATSRYNAQISKEYVDSHKEFFRIHLPYREG